MGLAFGVCVVDTFVRAEHGLAMCALQFGAAQLQFTPILIYLYCQTVDNVRGGYQLLTTLISNKITNLHHRLLFFCPLIWSQTSIADMFFQLMHDVNILGCPFTQHRTLISLNTHGHGG